MIIFACTGIPPVVCPLLFGRFMLICFYFLPISGDLSDNSQCAEIIVQFLSFIISYILIFFRRTFGPRSLNWNLKFGVFVVQTVSYHQNFLFNFSLIRWFLTEFWNKRKFEFCSATLIFYFITAKFFIRVVWKFEEIEFN